MSVSQISVFLENKMGQLTEVTNWMADRAINLHALSIADSQEFGILRVIVDQPERLLNALKEQGYTAVSTEMIAVAFPDKPGAMAKVLTVLSDEQIDVEYTYAFTSAKTDGAVMMFRVNDTEAAYRALQQKGIRLLESSDLF